MKNIVLITGGGKRLGSLIAKELSKESFHIVLHYNKSEKQALETKDEIINNHKKLKSTVSLLVSKIGEGRAIMFADNPNFRGAWYGTNRLFLNAILLGDKIYIP